MFIKENPIFIHNISKKKEKQRNCFFYFRTTVNRRTFVGRVGRTNEGRV